MSAQTPTIAGRHLYDPSRAGEGIALDSAAWFAWLEAPTTSRFSYPLFDPQVGYIVGFMTVRKERRQRGGMYWSAFRRTGQRLCKIYVGRSASVTQARLQAIADRLYRPGAGSSDNTNG